MGEGQWDQGKFELGEMNLILLPHWEKEMLSKLLSCILDKMQEEAAFLDIYVQIIRVFSS